MNEIPAPAPRKPVPAPAPRRPLGTKTPTRPTSGTKNRPQPSIQTRPTSRPTVPQPRPVAATTTTLRTTTVEEDDGDDETLAPPVRSAPRATTQR